MINLVVSVAGRVVSADEGQEVATYEFGPGGFCGRSLDGVWTEFGPLKSVDNSRGTNSAKFFFYTTRKKRAVAN